MLDLIIVGAGGFGRELHALLWDGFSQESYRFAGFLGQQESDQQMHELAAPLLGAPEHYAPRPQDRFLLAIGDIDARRRTVESLQNGGGQFASFVHPLAFVSATATVGTGAVIYPFAVLSNHAVLEDFVHLNYYASVGHDGQVGRYGLLAPYATLNGAVVLEDEVYVSTHATIVPARRVGRRSKISANTAVMQDVPAESFVFGVPGKRTPRVDLESSSR